MQVFEKKVSDGNDFGVGRNPNFNQKFYFTHSSHFSYFWHLNILLNLYQN